MTELDSLKPYICLAFAKNFHKMGPTTVGGVANWPDGSLPYLPKNPFNELSEALRVIRSDENNLLNQLTKNTSENVSRTFVKLMTETAGVGRSLDLSSYNGPADLRYRNKHLSKYNSLTDWAKNDFKILVDWLEKHNIFEEIGRITLFFNDEGQQCGLHRDYNVYTVPDHPDQFLWINLFPDRKHFYLLDPKTGIKNYIEHQIVMFDSQNWHGSDPHPLAAFSIRVDGILNQNLLEKALQNSDS